MHDWRAHTGAWPLSQAYLALFLPHPLWAGASSLVYQALRSGVGGWPGISPAPTAGLATSVSMWSQDCRTAALGRAKERGM